jgi:hypothetical protein
MEPPATQSTEKTESKISPGPNSKIEYSIFIKRFNPELISNIIANFILTKKATKGELLCDRCGDTLAILECLSCKVCLSKKI